MGLVGWPVQAKKCRISSVKVTVSYMSVSIMTKIKLYLGFGLEGFILIKMTSVK